jgi:CPA2 family monovalent cation:H+ antiporter-2
MAIDMRELALEPLWLLACVAGLIGLKALILTGLGKLFQLSWPTAVELGLLLGPGGEFAFVAIGLAAALGVVAPRVASFALAVTSLTMVLIPLLAFAARRLRPMLEAPKPADPQLAVQPAPQTKHAIVVGYGRVGKVVCGLLEQHGVAYTATDHDAGTVSRDRRDGHATYFGDATNAEYLKACGIADASGVIITIHSERVIDAVVAQVRKMRPDLLIVSRARDADHARHLYELGVSDAVPETIEASLQLSEAALVALGIPTGPVIASVHEQRDVFRHELQEAAQKAGLSASHSIRRKAG